MINNSLINVSEESKIIADSNFTTSLEKDFDKLYLKSFKYLNKKSPSDLNIHLNSSLDEFNPTVKKIGWNKKNENYCESISKLIQKSSFHREKKSKWCSPHSKNNKLKNNPISPSTSENNSISSSALHDKSDELLNLQDLSLIKKIKKEILLDGTIGGNCKSQEAIKLTEKNDNYLVNKAEINYDKKQQTCCLENSLSERNNSDLSMDFLNNTDEKYDFSSLEPSIVSCDAESLEPVLFKNPIPYKISKCNSLLFLEELNCFKDSNPGIKKYHTIVAEN